MDILLNWLIALGVVLLIFAGIYLITKLAVKSALREVINEFGERMAKKLWEEDDAPSVPPAQEPEEPQEPQE